MLTDTQWTMLEPLVEQCRPRGKTPPQDLQRTSTAGGRWSTSALAASQSATCPLVSRTAMGRHRRSVRAWILVERPRRERPIAWSRSPLYRLPPSDGPSRPRRPSAREPAGRPPGPEPERA
jgi:hypothetical protein